MARHKIVRIDWRDACGGVRGGWRSLAACKASNTALCVSIGVLLDQTAAAVVVLPHLVHAGAGIAEHTQGDGEIAIPKGWIQKITTLGYL